jgi:GTP-binding protein
MTFAVNDSPLAGQDGKRLTSRMIRDRLMREQEGNVSIKVKDTDNTDTFEVAGRGELQIAILIENMRREGFELSIGRPRVLIKEENGYMSEIKEKECYTDDPMKEHASTGVYYFKKGKYISECVATVTNFILLKDYCLRVF